MRLLPLFEHIGWIGFMLAVHHRMMISAKQNQILGRVQLFFGKTGFSSWTIFTNCINVAYVSNDECVRFLSGWLNEIVCAVRVCTLVSAQSEQDFQCRG